MTKETITTQEKQHTQHWLSISRRFLAFIRGYTENCKRRSCKRAGMCTAHSFEETSEEKDCGRPLNEEDVTQTIQLALFGMMLEEGLLSDPDNPDANSRHN